MADILQITLPDGTTYDLKDSTAVTNVGWDSANKKIQKTINGTTSDVVVIPIIAGSGTDSAIGGVTSGTNACVASGTDSLAFGIKAQAIEECAIALGKNITASGKYSIALGVGSVASGQNTTAINGAKATGMGTFALGGKTSGHEPATASGMGAIAIGTNTLASNNYSIALGYQAEASGVLSMAIGVQNSATAQCAISIGAVTIAAANYALAMGLGTKASSQYQTALGKFNVEDDQDTYAFILGNGTADNARSNVMTVDWNGNISANNIVTSTSVSNTGLISFLNSNSTAVYTVQLPLYNGGVS